MKAMLRWRVARVVHSEPETGSAQTIGLTVPGWGGHVAGQHIDLKLTAEDGYSAQRSYSLSRPADGERIELTVQQIADGEVSPYLTGACCRRRDRTSRTHRRLVCLAACRGGSGSARRRRIGHCAIDGDVASAGHGRHCALSACLLGAQSR